MPIRIDLQALLLSQKMGADHWYVAKAPARYTAHRNHVHIGSKGGPEDNIKICRACHRQLHDELVRAGAER